MDQVEELQEQLESVQGRATALSEREASLSEQLKILEVLARSPALQLYATEQIALIL